MEFLQLKYFCDAAETQNFSHTAKKYFVPVPSVSQSIKRLEKELSAELFEHLGNKIILADKGKRFYKKAAEALSLLEEAKNEVMDMDAESKGEISMAVLCNRRVVSTAIEKFREKYPHVNFVLLYTMEQAVPCDIIISDSRPEGYYEKSALVEEEMLLALRADHRCASEEKVDIKTLSDEKFISMPKGRSLYTFTEVVCNRAGFAPDIAIQTEDPYYVRKYVEMGLGIAFIPSYSWQGLFSNEVVLKKIGDYKRTTYIYLQKNRKLKAAASAFLEYLN